MNNYEKRYSVEGVGISCSRYNININYTVIPPDSSTFHFNAVKKEMSLHHQ